VRGDWSVGSGETGDMAWNAHIIILERLYGVRFDFDIDICSIT
jgi:hypothetical protein